MWRSSIKKFMNIPQNLDNKSLEFLFENPMQKTKELENNLILKKKQR